MAKNIKIISSFNDKYTRDDDNNKKNNNVNSTYSYPTYTSKKTSYITKSIAILTVRCMNNGQT